MNEEHGFGNLFYSALTELIEKKKHEHSPVVDLNDFVGDFAVETEEATIGVSEVEDKRKRIDISIQGTNWAIIIENKLYHDVINPLHTYWNHIHKKHNTDRIIGIILSLYKVDKSKLTIKAENISYINITHQELIDAVGRQFNFSSNYNEVNLFYLKEYFRTIETHYSTKRNLPAMNKLVGELILQRERINSLSNKIKEADNHIRKTIKDSFTRKENFKCINETKLFFASDDIKDIFIAVTPDKLLSQNTLSIFLVAILTKDNGEWVEKVKQIARSETKNANEYYKIDGIFVGHDHVHIIAYTKDNFMDKDDKFDLKFENTLDEFFFKDNGIIEQLKRLK